MDTKTRERIAYHISNFADPEVKIACRAEGFLIRCYGDRALDQLVEACQHDDPKVRWRAAWTLGQIGNAEAFEAILNATSDPVSFVRFEAAWALGILGDPRAIEPLVNLVFSPDPLKPSFAAIQGLCELGDLAIPAVSCFIDHPDNEIRFTAISLIDKIKSGAYTQDRM